MITPKHVSEMSYEKIARIMNDWHLALCALIKEAGGEVRINRETLETLSRDAVIFALEDIMREQLVVSLHE